MFPYIPHTEQDKKEMLGVIGVDRVEDLFKDVPESVKLSGKLNINDALSEIEIKNHVSALADKNINLNKLSCFLGAGAYDHYIPSVIKHILSRTEFFTAYTPYQPEISQGTLQAIFEFQTMICNITDMDVANASMYDGQTACTEAAIMATEATRRKEIIVSKTVHPETRKVLKTYLGFRNIELIEVDDSEGSTDIEKIKSLVSKKTAAVIVQNPNFFGVIEELEDLAEQIHKNKSLLIMYVDPISLGILKTPGEIGADIAVGDAQSLGNALNYGGPYVGFMATSTKLMRKMPGRIVGETIDIEGQRGYVLTLQAREQHIRRDKATSNICSNQSLNALATAIYLTNLGKEGLKEVAMQCTKKAHYAFNELTKSGKYKSVYNKPFFMEFAVKSSTTVDKVNEELLKNNVLGGYNLEKEYPHYDNALLLCVTENRTKCEIDHLVRVMEGI